MGATASPERLIIAALVGLVILLVLIIGAKLQAILAILISAVAIGLMAGMPYSAILESVGTGMGNTLKGIALLVGLGSMFGAILEISGGAQRIATTLVDKFGESKAAWALGITGLVIAMPVFFDAGLIILIPLAFSLAKKTKKSTLCYAIPLLAGLAVGHAFIPPTPGPILVANMLGVELGYVIIVGLLAGTVAMIVAGPMFGKFIGSKIYVPVPKSVQEMEECDETKLPIFDRGQHYPDSVGSDYFEHHFQSGSGYGGSPAGAGVYRGAVYCADHRDSGGHDCPGYQARVQQGRT